MVANRGNRECPRCGETFDVGRQDDFGRCPDCQQEIRDEEATKRDQRLAGLQAKLDIKLGDLEEVYAQYELLLGDEWTYKFVEVLTRMGEAVRDALAAAKTLQIEEEIAR